MIDEAEFRCFFSEIHPGRGPYRWQIRLAAELAAGAELDALVAPTGAGKTTLIECFAFALAEQLARGERRLPLRLFWVVDRRSVVDQVYAHVCAVAAALGRAGGDSATGRVAAALRTAGVERDAPALEVRLWRGGTERGVEPVPLMTPSVVCSTVDQVGSRLLFRGYGTSPSSRPVDAALVGTDSLIVLDEAHLSQPFADTARAVEASQRSGGRQVVPPARLLHVTATLAAVSASTRRFELRPDERAEEPLARRLRAKKLVTLRPASGSLPAALASAARDLAADRRVVGVVANTIADARAAHRELAVDHEALLIIGPSRPHDRDEVLSSVPGREDRAGRTTPLFVVGTQTLEVGIDLDFDALVTACAPLPSLTQRFGRLDRAGLVTEAEGHAVGVIVRAGKSDPVYGDAPAVAWKWLDAHRRGGELDLGPAGIESRSGDEPPAPLGPRAPLLGPWHVEVLAQTSREPVPTPEIGYFLHGEHGRRDPDVTLLWRADITADNAEEWAQRVRARPPHAAELLTLPLARVRRWLAGGGDELSFGDIESADAADTPRADPSRDAIVYGRVCPPGPDGGLDVDSERKQLRPGDVLVIPSLMGGCDEFGWAPDSTEPVEDLGDHHPHRPRLLLDRRVDLPPQLQAQLEAVTSALVSDEISRADAYRRLREPAGAWKTELGERGTVIPLPAEQPTSLVLVPQRPRVARARAARQRYDEHVDRVVALSTAHARACGLDDDLVRTIGLAARYHDLGKLDPRFQAWLNGGVPPGPGEVLAKSGLRPGDPRSVAHRLAAGWPKDKRHELSAAVMVAEAVRQGAFSECDTELLIHLILVHHGQFRPFFPVHDQPDDAPVEAEAAIEGRMVRGVSSQELGFGEHADRFARLVERYGPWGLAALEAMLVVADRVASAEARE